MPGTGRSEETQYPSGLSRFLLSVLAFEAYHDHFRQTKLGKVAIIAKQRKGYLGGS